MLRLLALLLLAAVVTGRAAPVATDGWARENLVAWCIVPFDAKKRGPEERAAMLERLQLRKFAYDWRDEHIASFDEEVTATRRHGIEMVAWWFPTKLDDKARTILSVIERHKIHPQLWIMGGGEPPKEQAGQAVRIAREVARIRPIAGEAARLGCQVGLYNHGGWFGEPENQLAILEALRAERVRNVGLVYNFHHGHEHLERFATMWPKMQSSVLAVNLNGMVADGEKSGRKILYLGEGDREAALIRLIRASGWSGLVGVLCHRTDVDAEVALQRNLDGYARIVAAGQ